LDYDDEGLISKIWYQDSNDGDDINFLDKIKSKAAYLRFGHPDRFSLFDNKWKFYLVNMQNTEYVLGIGKISNTEYKKIRYCLNGMVLANVTDCLTENNIICRIDGNT